jgi:hypothetical protein
MTKKIRNIKPIFILGGAALLGYTFYNIGNLISNANKPFDPSLPSPPERNLFEQLITGATYLVGRPQDILPAIDNAVKNVINVPDFVGVIQDMNGAPRGLRNNNPGNIRDFGINWRGRVETDNGPGGPFVVFDTMENGLRALMRNLYSRSNDDGAGNTTIAAAITAWAPPSENDTRSYVNFVSVEAGLPSTSILNPRNSDMMAEIARAIVIKENGRNAVNTYAPALLDLPVYWQAWRDAGLNSL